MPESHHGDTIHGGQGPRPNPYTRRQDIAGGQLTFQSQVHTDGTYHGHPNTNPYNIPGNMDREKRLYTEFEQYIKDHHLKPGQTFQDRNGNGYVYKGDGLVVDQDLSRLEVAPAHPGESKTPIVLYASLDDKSKQRG